MEAQRLPRSPKESETEPGHADFRSPRETRREAASSPGSRPEALRFGKQLCFSGAGASRAEPSRAAREFLERVRLAGSPPVISHPGGGEAEGEGRQTTPPFRHKRAHFTTGSGAIREVRTHFLARRGPAASLPHRRSA